MKLARAGETSISAELLAESATGLRRLGLRSFAESVLDRTVPVSPIEIRDRFWKLHQDPEGGRLDLGGGASFLVEAGLIRVVAGEGDVPVAEPVDMAVPGSCGWGPWTIRAEILGTGRRGRVARPLKWQLSMPPRIGQP